ncbi:hypothetical protein [Puia dinghuensis]|uniref:Uncharacterized protein n=1 Tax=Puia dinghuensis TaxID=1792502 RepID=A0A8J2XRD6_9BACT|nr:hypothetical protein [Puia dinghuensis]GGA88667.1 hypothetical protein GCM10011511_09860 [Puia dinghuensis]
MLKGIYLTLMIGPGVPLIAPQVVVDALTGVQVTSSKDRSGFQLTFAVAKNSPLITTMLPAGYFDPIITRVLIIVTLNGVPNVLMDGLITNQEYAPSNEVGQSVLTITGEDLSVAMDVLDMVIPYPFMPDEAIVNLVLAKYLVLGVTPLVIPPIIPVIKTAIDGWITQRGTDREFIKERARINGYVFFVDPGPVPGQSIAYFGPDINLPIPQPALTINMDSATNVESLSFSLDGLAKKIRLYTIYDPFTDSIPIPVPVPNVNIFKPPLGVRPTPPARFEIAQEGSELAIDEAAQTILGFMMNNSTAITASGSLDVMRYEQILRARLIVGVRGAGLAYDGLYYVDSVTHNIKQGEYKQNFTLSRDGLISNTPMLIP